MPVATVTNTTNGANYPGTQRSLSVVETLTGGTGTSALSATGGNVTDPLPYPFAHIRTLTAGGTAVYAMHPRDFLYKAVPWLPHDPATEWNKIIQEGSATLVLAAQTNATDSESAAYAAVYI